MVVIVIVVIAVAAYFLYRAVVYTQMSEETAARESWVTDTGTLLREDEDSSVKIYRDDRQEDMEIYQIVPSDVENENYTYYDPDVQQRLDDTLQALKSEADYSLEEPLAVWNPYGTGSNGLYLYFDAQNAAQVAEKFWEQFAALEEHERKLRVLRRLLGRGYDMGLARQQVEAVIGSLEAVEMDEWEAEE